MSNLRDFVVPTGRFLGFPFSHCYALRFVSRENVIHCWGMTSSSSDSILVVDASFIGILLSRQLSVEQFDIVAISVDRLLLIDIS